MNHPAASGGHQSENSKRPKTRGIKPLIHTTILTGLYALSFIGSNHFKYSPILEGIVSEFLSW
jgi:hypothetical protein